MSWLPFIMTLALTVPSDPSSQGEPRRPTAPETFTANAQVIGTAGASATTLTIQVDKYSPDADRDAVLQALKQGGHAAFVEALRKAPAVGKLTMGGQTFDIRWARQERLPNARNIVLVTDKPTFFVGGGAVTAKPREGFDVAVLRFRMDDAGVGYDGTMAAAARVKSGATGVEIDDYAEKPIELRSITRAFK